MLAQAWGGANLRSGTEMLLTELEHHSNLVPWQLIARETGARVRYIPVDGQGVLQLDGLDALLTERTKIVAFAQMSNMLGTITPAAEIVRRAKAGGALAP